MSINTVPQKEGFYWLRWKSAMAAPPTETNRPYTMIAHVIGVAPFMRVAAWFFAGDVATDTSTFYISVDRMIELEWGPQILRPGDVAMRDA